MTQPILSRIPFLGKLVDERFLEHRRRSGLLAGIAGALTAFLIFEYSVFFQHVVRRDLLAVLAVMGFVKLSLLIWYRITD